MNSLSQILGASTEKIWVSGRTYAQFAKVISPADGELYIRSATAGSGTTDPANDLTNYRAVSYERCAAIVGSMMVPNSGTITSCFAGATKTVIGALAVGTRTQVLSVTGRGCLDYLAHHRASVGSSRVEVIADGHTKLDRTDATYSTTDVLLALGMCSAGSTATAALAEARFDPSGVQFRRTLEVWVTNTASAGSASATVAYHLRSIA